MSKQYNPYACMFIFSYLLMGIYKGGGGGGFECKLLKLNGFILEGGLIFGGDLHLEWCEHL